MSSSFDEGGKEGFVAKHFLELSDGQIYRNLKGWFLKRLFKQWKLDIDSQA